ncbi:MAG: 23S rRNA pseudouridine(955/2504/2580) synthase, partial [Betaproteobacteria bacterium]|nr:23S rRNA pseudouridine(955/2504/2580) synthase [Betaproteobacteria bacterium]
MTHQGARHLRIDPEYAGQRIDNYLIRELAALPRTRIYRMIRSGEVRLDGRRVRAEQRLLGGEDLRIPPMRV